MLSQDEIARALRLQSIFMPEAQRRRDAIAETQGVKFEPGQFLRFAHYTTAEAALNIIKTKRLWMRSTTCMADFREVNHGFEMLLHYFQAGDNRTDFLAAFDEVHPGVAREAIGTFDSWWTTGQLALNIFISSISEHLDSENQNGRLSMWRAFGAGASIRVALIVKIPFYSGALEKTGILFSPVSYLSDDQLAGVLTEVKANIRGNVGFLKELTPEEMKAWIFQMLFAGVTCLKHEGFHEEREWRAIYCPKVFGEVKMIEQEAQVVAGVPQHVQRFPLDVTAGPDLKELDLAAMLDRVIIGPSSFPWVTYNVFAEALTKLGVADASNKVHVSAIPIRS